MRVSQPPFTNRRSLSVASLPLTKALTQWRLTLLTSEKKTKTRTFLMKKTLNVSLLALLISNGAFAAQYALDSKYLAVSLTMRIL